MAKDLPPQIKATIENCFDPIERTEVLSCFSDISLWDLLKQVQNLGAPEKGSPIKSVAGKMLIGINARVKDLEPIEKKNRIKKYIASFFRKLISDYCNQFPKRAWEILADIQDGLDEAIDLRDYDRSDFDQYFKLDWLRNKFPPLDGDSVNVDSLKDVSFSLNWNGHQADLELLAERMVTAGVIQQKLDWISFVPNPSHGIRIIDKSINFRIVIWLLEVCIDKQLLLPSNDGKRWKHLQQLLQKENGHTKYKQQLHKIASKIRNDEYPNSDYIKETVTELLTGIEKIRDNSFVPGDAQIVCGENAPFN